MLAIANLVHETSTSTGTGNFTLASVNGKQSFNDAFSTGGTDVFHYFISNRDAAEWEYGSGHMSDATTLVRDTVIESSNSNSAVSFSAGVKDVTNDVPASERVAGPASSTAGYFPQFSDTSGKVFTSGKAAPSGNVVGTSDTQTLTNKTLTSPTISGSLTITAAGSVGIEIGRQDNVASTPYFDFHSGATSVDYDARLIASGGTGSNGGGILTVVGADFLAPVGSNAASVVTVGGSQTLTNKTLTDAIVGTQSPGDNSTKAASTGYVDAAVAAGGGGGDVVLLDSGSISTPTATLDIVLTSYSAYRMLQLVLQHVVPSTDDMGIRCRFSSDGGSTYATTNYQASLTGTRAGGTAANGLGSGLDHIKLAETSASTAAVSNVAAEGGANIVVEMNDHLNSSLQPQIVIRNSYVAAVNELVGQAGGGRRTTAQAIDAIRILSESGNIASCKWALYGYK